MPLRPVELRVIGDTSDAKRAITDLKARKDELAAHAATISVDLKGNDKALFELKKTGIELDRIDRKLASPKVDVRGVRSADLALDRLSIKLTKLGTKDAVVAGEGVAALGGNLSELSGVAMPAAIGGLVALTGQASVLAFGLGGLALAAIPVIKNTQLMHKTLAPLRSEYSSFSKQLQPDVMGVFNKGVGLAGHLLADVQPVAHETGKALVGVLGSVDKELASGTWQEFFGFMRDEASGDVAQLGHVLTDLVHILPTVAEDFHSLGSSMLTDVDGAVKLTGQIADLEHNLSSWPSFNDKASSSSIGNFLKATGRQAVESLLPGVAGIHKFQAAVDKASAGQKHFATAAQVAARAAAAEQQNMESLASSIDKTAGSLLQLQGDEVSWRQAQHDATKALQDNNHALKGNSDAALADKQALIHSSEAAIQAARNQITLNHNTGAANKIINNQIQYLVTHAGKSRFAQKEVEALIRAEYRIPHSISSVIHAKTAAAAAAIAAIENRMARLNGRTSTVYVDYSYGGQSYVAPHHRHVGFHAEGTPSAKPGWSWVGERGPELVNLKGGETILPFAESMRKAASGFASLPGHAAGASGGGSTGPTYVINVAAPRGSEAEAGRIVVEQIKRYEHRNGKGWRR